MKTESTHPAIGTVLHGAPSSTTQPRRALAVSTVQLNCSPPRRLPRRPACCSLSATGAVCQNSASRSSRSSLHALLLAGRPPLQSRGVAMPPAFSARCLLIRLPSLARQVGRLAVGLGCGEHRDRPLINGTRGSHRTKSAAAWRTCSTGSTGVTRFTHSGRNVRDSSTFCERRTTVCDSFGLWIRQPISRC